MELECEDEDDGTKMNEIEDMFDFRLFFNGIIRVIIEWFQNVSNSVKKYQKLSLSYLCQRTNYI